MQDAQADSEILQMAQVLLAEHRHDADVMAAGLRSFFGVYYRDSMKPSPLVGRLARMRAELERGDDALERKLRYLFWLN